MKQSARSGLRGWIILLAMLLPQLAQAQVTVIRGRVSDERDRPLPYVNVVLGGTDEGTNTDDKGNYELRTQYAAVSRVIFSYLGYKTVERPVSRGTEQVMNIRMSGDSRELKEVVVKPGRFKYRNKNNPAVALIDLVIAHKESNTIGSFDYASYSQYEKMSFALSNTPQKLRRNILFRRYQFMIDNIDTTTLPGLGLMPWYMQERLSEVYYRRSPEKRKTIVTGDKKVDFGEFIDNQGMNAYLKHMYQDIDIYKNNIYVVTNQFLSPIANTAPTFYKYFITDTVGKGADRWVELSFFPRNKADFLFQGKLYVTLDGRYAVPKVDMTINKNINMNWVKHLDIHLDFSKDSAGFYELSKSTLTADFGLLKSSRGGIYGKREVSFRNYRFNQPAPDSIYRGLDLVELESVGTRPDSFWSSVRTDSLTKTEQNTYVAIDKLSKSKSFKRTMDLVTLVIAGYKKASPYAEIGPVNTFYGFNPVEGFRLRLGGRTTPRFSKRINFETYGAYGFKDEKFKYYFGTTYSFTKRSIYEFPVVSLAASYQHDTKIPGQELQFVQEDNFLLSFKRGVNDRYLYNDIYKINFLQEFRNHFSYQLSYKHWKQIAAGGLHYEHDEGGIVTPVPHLITSELGLELRYAPKEEFYQGKLYRIPILNRYPVFTLRSNFGVKNLLGGEYNYQNLVLNVYKHVYLSQLGYADVVLEGGQIFGRAPYPLLDIHRANQSYSLQLQSYNLMNFLEFVSDHYASFYLDHCFNGFFFNKVPLLKKAKLREYINFKALYGGLREENDPRKTPGLLQFPTDANGRSITYTLEKEPYIEGSVGIGNIFNFFRIDLVKRFTYLDNPNVSTLGIRGRFKFDF